MPPLRDLVDKQQDMLIIHAMFGIRLKLWDGEVLNAQDQPLWDAVKDQVPQWALFHRLNLNEGQKQARKEAERQVEREFESLSDDSDNGYTPAHTSFRCAPCQMVLMAIRWPRTR